MGDAQSVPSPAELAEQLSYAAFLFWQSLAEMEAEEIESVQLSAGPNNPGRTAKVMVADLAFCDDRSLRRLQAALTGMPAAPASQRLQVDNDTRILDLARRPWMAVEHAAKDARQRLVDFTRSLTPEDLTLVIVEATAELSIAEHLQERANSLWLHRGKVQLYCGSLARWGRPGLRKLMVEQHDNLMDAMAGLSEETMLAVQVCGSWTIRDVYAHVLGWNEYCAKLLRHWPEPNPELIGEWKWLEADTMASFNDRILAARAHLTMIEIADGLTSEFRRMMRVFDKAGDAALCSEGLTWGGYGVMSNFFYEIFVHEAEHAAQIWAFRAGVSGEEAELNRSDDS